MTTKRTVVVVDDDENQARIFEEHLKDSGYTVHLAFTGMEGLQKILDFRPDIVLLDLFLPDMKGSDVCAQLRASTATQQIPIIICTAYNIDSIEKMKGFRAGADDYMVRPFELSELTARMEAILRRAALQPRAETLAGISALLKKPAPVPASMPVKVASAAPVRSTHTPIRHEPPQFFKRVWEILNHPFRALKTVDDHQDFVVGLALVLATPTIASFAKLLQNAGGFDGWIGMFSLGMVVNLVMWFGTAGLLHMALPFQGQAMSMRRALTIGGLAWAPRLLATVLSLVYAVIGLLTLGGERIELSAGLNIIPGLPSNGFVSFVSHIGLFEFWSAWLTLVALWCAGPSERRWNSVTIVVGISCLLFGALSAF